MACQSLLLVASQWAVDGYMRGWGGFNRNVQENLQRPHRVLQQLREKHWLVKS